MNIAQIKQIAITDFMEAIGIRPVKETPFAAWYHAPYREDKHPSFKVNRKRNQWYDFGTGQSGDIIDLGTLIYHTKDLSRVLKLIGQAAPAVPLRTRTAIQQSGTDTHAEKQAQVFQNIRTGALSSPVLKSYLASRGIAPGIGEAYCEEIHYTFGRKAYYALAFRNMGGGYEIRNPYFKGCIAPKEITLIGSGCPTATCCLFEGFIDFLSCQTMAGQGRIGIPCGPYDCIVLNSVNTLSGALPLLKRYMEIYCYLDNDDAGRRVVDLLQEMGGKAVYNMMEAYPLYKDVNDLLLNKKKMP